MATNATQPHIPMIPPGSQSIARLARLEPTVLAGGHGQPMAGTATAETLKTSAGPVRNR